MNKQQFRTTNLTTICVGEHNKQPFSKIYRREGNAGLSTQALNRDVSLDEELSWDLSKLV